MKLGHIEIFVSDPVKAKAFYQDILGFELTAVQGDAFVWLKKDNVEFLLRAPRAAPAADSYQQSPAAIVLYTDDLPAMMEHLRSKGLQFAGDDGSPSCLTFTDPDGNWFQLTDPSGH